MSSFKITTTEWWQEYGKVLLVILGILASLYVYGGIKRVSNGQSFWQATQETSYERQARLLQCSQVDKDLGYYQSMDSGDSGVCSGFSAREIEQAQKYN